MSIRRLIQVHATFLFLVFYQQGFAQTNLFWNVNVQSNATVGTLKAQSQSHSNDVPIGNGTWVNTNSFGGGGSSVTNGLATTNQLSSTSNTLAAATTQVNTLATTALNAALNSVQHSETNAFASTNQNVSGFPNDALYVTKSVTNGLDTITNSQGITNATARLAFTNGLDTITARTGATNETARQAFTNGLETVTDAQGITNTTARLAFTNGLPDTAKLTGTTNNSALAGNGVLTNGDTRTGSFPGFSVGTATTAGNSGSLGGMPAGSYLTNIAPTIVRAETYLLFDGSDDTTNLIRLAGLSNSTVVFPAKTATLSTNWNGLTKVFTFAPYNVRWLGNGVTFNVTKTNGTGASDFMNIEGANGFYFEKINFSMFVIPTNADITMDGGFIGLNMTGGTNRNITGNGLAFNGGRFGVDTVGTGGANFGVHFYSTIGSNIGNFAAGDGSLFAFGGYDSIVDTVMASNCYRVVESFGPAGGQTNCTMLAQNITVMDCQNDAFVGLNTVVADNIILRNWNISSPSKAANPTVYNDSVLAVNNTIDAKVSDIRFASDGYSNAGIQVAANGSVEIDNFQCTNCSAVVNSISATNVSLNNFNTGSTTINGAAQPSRIDSATVSNSVLTTLSSGGNTKQIGSAIVSNSLFQLGRDLGLTNVTTSGATIQFASINPNFSPSVVGTGVVVWTCDTTSGSQSNFLFINVGTASNKRFWGSGYIVNTGPNTLTIDASATSPFNVNGSRYLTLSQYDAAEMLIVSQKQYQAIVTRAGIPTSSTIVTNGGTGYALGIATNCAPYSQTNYTYTGTAPIITNGAQRADWDVDAFPHDTLTGFAACSVSNRSTGKVKRFFWNGGLVANGTNTCSVLDVSPSEILDVTDISQGGSVTFGTVTGNLK